MDKPKLLDNKEKARREWYKKQPKGCTCRAIFYNELWWERCNPQGCPHHCDHRGIMAGGRCSCGIKV